MSVVGRDITTYTKLAYHPLNISRYISLYLSLLSTQFIAVNDQSPAGVITWELRAAAVSSLLLMVYRLSGGFPCHIPVTNTNFQFQKQISSN